MNEMMYADAACLIINIGSLVLLSVQDIRRKHIGVVPLTILGILNAVLCIFMGRDALHILTGLVPGVFALLVALVTKGKMGMGDGLVLLALGLVYDWDKVLALWLVALLLSAVTGIILMITKKAGLKTAMAFVPYILAGYVFLEVTERVAV